jgi:glyoxylase I family protein
VARVGRAAAHCANDDGYPCGHRPLGKDGRVVSPTPLRGLSHLDLSVSDRHASARWYADVLGFEIRGDRFNASAGLQWIHVVHPCGLRMGLVEHPDNPGEPFDERRTGLDHVSFAVASRHDVDDLAHRSAVRGYTEGSVQDTDNAALLVLRDPDNIQIELCYWKVRDRD